MATKLPVRVIVLTPGQSAVTDDVSQKNILQIAIASPDHTTLVAGVQAGDLVESLANARSVHSVSHPNAAFEALPGTLDDLRKPEEQGALRKCIAIPCCTKHVFTDNNGRWSDPGHGEWR